MNDKQIYALMAQKPDIRAVQIADALDAELSDVSAALRSLVDVGDVIQSKGEAPNGHQAMIYNLSPVFKKSDEYKRIVAQQAAKAAIVDPTTTPPPAAPPEVESSKIDLAVAYITQEKCVADTDLRRIMGLKPNQYPSAYLAAAVKSGRVTKTLSGWKPGAGNGTNDNTKPSGATPVKRAYKKRVAKPAEQTAAKVLGARSSDPAQTTGTPVPASTLSVQAQLGRIAAGQPAPTELLTSKPKSTAPIFRCGLWSDDILELQRDGEKVATLTRREGEHLAEFIGRMAGAIDRAAA